MATYAIGDIHGCWPSLRALLGKLPFDPARDRLWLVGDLVNRGPDSLAVLRWASELSVAMGERLVAVLGNHDLHLLARHAGLVEAKNKDTLEAVLDARDIDDLVGWLRALPFLHLGGVHAEGDHLLVHAGLRPKWTVSKAVAAARKLEAAHRKPQQARVLLQRDADGDQAAGLPAGRRKAQEAFTLLRTCTVDGELCASFSGPPREAPKGCVPWFDVPGRRSTLEQGGVAVVCGHWAALGRLLRKDLVALDSACVWGDELTAVRLDDRKVFKQKALE